MTPNPHPASGNGDVIERADSGLCRSTIEWIEERSTDFVSVYRGIDIDTVRKFLTAMMLANVSFYDADAALQEFAKAGLLKLSEGSNPCSKIFDHKWLDPECVENGCQSLKLTEGSSDGKMREALQEIRTWFLECSQMTGRACAMEHTRREEARHIVDICDKALATPAQSPIDAEGMREALGDCFCPRPANGDPDQLEIRECVKLGHCGCKMGAVFSSALRALPTPAREIDREKALTLVEDLRKQAKNRASKFGRGTEKSTVEWKAANTILSLIGGRHV